MRTVIVIITSLQVLWHGLAGCCAHAGHGDREHVASAGVAATCCPHAATEDGDSHEHHALPANETCAEHGSSHDGEDSNPGPHQCPHDSCQWIVQKDISAGGDVLAAVWAPTADVFADVAPLTLAAQRVAFLAGPHGPPLRLHLSLGVLVI